MPTETSIVCLKERLGWRHNSRENIQRELQEHKKQGQREGNERQTRRGKSLEMEMKAGENGRHTKSASIGHHLSLVTSLDHRTKHVFPVTAKHVVKVCQTHPGTFTTHEKSESKEAGKESVREKQPSSWSPSSFPFSTQDKRRRDWRRSQDNTLCLSLCFWARDWCPMTRRRRQFLCLSQESLLFFLWHESRTTVSLSCHEKRQMWILHKSFAWFWILSLKNLLRQTIGVTMQVLIIPLEYHFKCKTINKW